MTKKRKTRLYRGWPLVDAKEGIDLEICVEKQDVRGAKKNDPANCAAAKALSRALHTEAEVHLSRTYIKNNKENVWVRYMTPSAISREIVSFDRSSIFEPGDYTLKAPTVSQKLGNYRGKSTHPRTNKKRKSHITVNVRESARGKHRE